MVLIKENITEAMTMLEDLLMNFVENETVVNIHTNINGNIVRHSVRLEEFNIEQDDFYVSSGWFELDIRKEIVQIDYEGESCVHIQFVDGELYLDFEKSESKLE